MIICNQCKLNKPKVDFYKRDSGTYLKCKECCKANAKKSYEDNKESVKQRTKAYKTLHKENNTEIHKKLLHNNKVRQAEYQKTAQGKLVNAAAQHLRRLQIKGNVSDVTTEKLKELQGTQEDCCFYCFSKLNYTKPRAVHLDHIVPLSKGGLHRMDNVVWSCSTCNMQKSNKVLDLESL